VSVKRVEQFWRTPVLLGEMSAVADDVPRCLYGACNSDVCVLPRTGVSNLKYVIHVSDCYIKVKWLEMHVHCCL